MESALTSVVVLFGAALLVAWLMRALKAPAILGYLLAGILIGPSGLGLISDGHHDPAQSAAPHATTPAHTPTDGDTQSDSTYANGAEAADEHGQGDHAADHGATTHHDVHFFAELGLVLLLFSVGLELSPRPLIRMGKRLAIAAGLQMGLTTLIGLVGVMLALQLGFGAALITGLAISLSSTAIVLKHLSDRGQTDTSTGTLITGVLLVQDIVVILVLVLLPFVGGGNLSLPALLLKILLAIGGLVIVTLIARLVLPGIINMVFRRGGAELMTLFAIVMASLGAWLASLADWSWPLGAFIAGLLLAQSDLRHQLHAEITPFRDAFNALFFISIGMLVDVQIVVDHGVALTLAVVATLVVKTLLTSGAVLAAGWPLRLGLTAGIGLSTISEFGYVLVKEADKLELVPPTLITLLVAWTVGTMLVGALLLPVATPISAWLARNVQSERDEPAPAGDGHGTARSSHVIIVGYGINGRNLATVLRATRIPYVVIEMNRTNAQHARKDGAEVIVGDAARMTILHSAGFHAARALVVAIADVWAARRIVAQAHAARPDLYILARTRQTTEVEPLFHAGAREVIPEEFETSIEIFAHVLQEFGVPSNIITQQIKLTRSGHYGMLRGETAAQGRQRNEWLQLLEASVTQTHLVGPDSPAAGRTIRELDLRANTGVTIVAITRAGKPTPTPPPEFRIEPMDVLVLVGTHHQLDQARLALEGEGT